MARKITLVALVVVLLFFGAVSRANASVAPIRLLVPQGTAFSVLHYDCGGITEHAYATGYDNSLDPAAGYPTGDVFLTTTCSAGKGTHFTVSKWTSDTWDLAGALLSDAVLPAAPTVDPNFTATDPLTGNALHNTTNFNCTSQAGAVPNACLQWAPTFTPRPRVTGISKTEGPATGASSVTISGDAFTAATQVYFGTTLAASVTINSDTSITAVSPPDTSGTNPDAVDVTVASPGGTSFTNANDQFTFYVQPTITGVNPNSGPMSGGYYVAVTGTNFVGTTGVNVGDVVSAFQVIDNNTLSVYIPGSDSSPGDSTSISVTSPGGTSPATPFDQFTYNNSTPPPPTSVTVTPAHGRPRKIVKVAGTAFAAAEQVTAVYLTGLSVPNISQVTICSATTTSTGSFLCKGKIPKKAIAGAKGIHTIVVTGSTGDSASTNFNLT
jgi:hypothetical protein